MLRTAYTAKLWFVAVLFSFCVHLAVVYVISFYFEVEKIPVIYSWSGIMRQRELFGEKKRRVRFPPDIFRHKDYRRDYFLASLPSHNALWISQDEGVYPSRRERDTFGQPVSHVYLWDRTVLLPSGRKERVSYRVYVSPYGKVVFAFPSKLAFNSHGAILSQRYLRTASLFLKDKFFWTKLDEIVE